MIIQMNKILPVKEPITKTYLFEAYPLTIMAAYGDEYEPWLLSNYIHIDCNNDINDLFMTFYGPLGIYSPYLKTQRIFWSSFTKLDIDIHNFIENHINQKYYMYFQVDDYYVPNSLFYKMKKHVHDLMIYGYDNDKKIYNIIGYDNKFIYNTSIITYEEFKHAFINNDVDKEENPWADQILMLKYNHNAEYSFNLQLVKDLIADYLDSKNYCESANPFKNSSINKIYGISTIDKLKEYIAEAKRNSNINFNILDLRAFRIIKEHCTIMLKRVKYISANILDVKDFIIDFERAEDISNKCFNLCVQYNLLFDKSILDYIYRSLYDLKELQENSLKELLALL